MAAQTQVAFPQEAYDLLIHRIYKPVFLEKLAEHNIIPRDPQEEMSLMEVAGLLRNQQASQLQKEASQSPINEGADALKRLLASQGMSPVPTTGDRLVKEAAHSLVQNPTYLEAAAAFGGYLASLGN